MLDLVSGELPKVVDERGQLFVRCGRRGLYERGEGVVELLSRVGHGMQLLYGQVDKSTAFVGGTRLRHVSSLVGLEMASPSTGQS